MTWDAAVLVDKEDRKLKFNIIRGVNFNSERTHSFLHVNLNH